jgi:hypothetical protein
MRLQEFFLLYLLVGLGCTLVRMLHRNSATRGERFADGALLTLLWPLYGPLVLASSSPAAARGQVEVHSRLGDGAAVTELEGRLKQCHQRVAEIDVFLASPAFEEEHLTQKKKHYQKEKHQGAAAAAAQQLQAIERLKALRAQLSNQLTEATEVLNQFRIQMELIRLSGRETQTRHAADEAIRELHLTMESLDEILQHDPTTAASLAAPWGGSSPPAPRA